MKTFKHWTRQDIANTFGLKVKKECEDLDNWLQSDELIPEDTKRDLIRLQEKLRDNVDVWNEQELIFQFIALLIDKVNYDNDLYKLFANRRLSGDINGETVSGEVDMMIASGQFEPQKPYFCLHEYKKEKGADNDPLGQLIIAMMTAQAINDDTDIIYGTYVMGRYWYFLTLKNGEYCVSESYTATRDDDIFTIFKILKKLKGIIEEMVTETV